MAFKIYTKTGDAGRTALFGGRRVYKNHLRVEAYGTIDELNAFIGLLCDHLSPSELCAALKAVQDRLFSLGAYLAADPAKQPPTPDLLPQDLAFLESAIDDMEKALPPLKNFIIPGGSTAVSLCHVCRTICRRAERQVVALHQKEKLEALVLQYLNRLSDYFFVLGRYVALQQGVEEIVWRPRK